MGAETPEIFPEEISSEELETRPQPERDPALVDRLREIIRTVSGKKDLEVTTEVDLNTFLKGAMEGRDVDKEWFWQKEKDPKTGQGVRERYSGAGRWVDEARKDDVSKAPKIPQENLGYVPKFAQLSNLIVYA